MAKTRASTLKIINQFVKVAKKQLDIKKIVLFGSHATSKAHEWSDIDLAVVSDDFKDMDFHDRLLLLNRITWDGGMTEIDALGYTSEEFETENPLDLVTEIKEHCVVVYEKL